MVKNIIFDFGGVLLNLDFKRSFQAFKDLGFSNVEGMFTQHSANDLFQKLEKGLITAENFYEDLKALAPKPVSDAQLQDAWNAMLVSYRKESLDFLTELRKGYNIYLLSNTNAIHYSCFSMMLQQETRYRSLEDFFIKAWYSHEIKRRKPDIETFEFVLKDAGIEAGETLFIDDSHSNLPNAAALGIKTHLLSANERIENLNYAGY